MRDPWYGRASATLTHMHVHTYARTHIHIGAHMQLHVSVPVYRYICARLTWAESMCTNTYSHAYTHHTCIVCVQAHMHTYGRAHASIYTSTGVMSTHRQVRVSPVRMGLWGLLPTRRGCVRSPGTRVAFGGATQAVCAPNTPTPALNPGTHTWGPVPMVCVGKPRECPEPWCSDVLVERSVRAWGSQGQ